MHISSLLEIQSFRLQFRMLLQNITSKVTRTSPIEKIKPMFQCLIR